MIYACLVCGEPQNKCGHNNCHIMTKDKAAGLAFAYFVMELDATAAEEDS